MRVGPSSLAEVVHPHRSVRPGVLLVEDHLLEQRQAAATVLLGPSQAGPPVLGQVAVPRQPALVRLMVTAGPAGATQGRPLPHEMVGQPCAHLGPEGLVLG